MVKRRDFLKLGAAAGILGAGQARAESHEIERGGRDYSYLSGTEREAIATICDQCPSHCPAVAYKDGDYIVKVEGNPLSQRTGGAMCAKGLASVNQIDDPDRILSPMKREGERGSGQWKKIGWEEALEELTERLQALRDAGEPERFVFHHGWISASAKHLIRDLFLPAYGTGSVASNTCLGQSARLTAHELVWGDAVDSWDFDNARFVLNFGSNVLEAHTDHVALARRLSRRLADRRLEMVTFDVRLSNTGARCGNWVQLKPGTDAAVVLAMCHVVVAEELYRGDGEAFLRYCRVTADPRADTPTKLAALSEHLRPMTPEWAAEISGVEADAIRDIARQVATIKPACIISSRGAGAQYNGVMVERAIMMLAALTGNIDNPGGRCVGVTPAWQFPQLADRPEVRALDILEGEAGEAAIPLYGVGQKLLRRIRAGDGGRPGVYMWYHYNPVYSNGNVAENQAILRDTALIPYTVAVTPFYDESAELADLILPDAHFLETYDVEDAPSPNQIAEYALRQPVAEPDGDARDFKDVCLDLASRLDLALDFETGEHYVEEICMLTPEVDYNVGFSGLQETGVWQDEAAEPRYYSYREALTADTYEQEDVLFDEGTGVYWNWRRAGLESRAEAEALGYAATAQGHDGYVGQRVGERVVAGFQPGRIKKTGLFELYSPLLQEKGFDGLPTYSPIPGHEGLKPNELILTTFRLNVQTLSRTQNCRWLNEIDPESPAWINPETAESIGIGDGDTVTAGTALGEVELQVKVTENVVPGVLAISSHGARWQYGRYASGNKAPFAIPVDDPYERLIWWTSKGVHINSIIDNLSEPISGQQRWMDTVVTVVKA